MNDSRVIHGGDVYCPRCSYHSVAVDITYASSFWFCDRCGHRWDWNHNGIDWIWPEDAKLTPGCPFCGTQNIDYAPRHDDDRNGVWHCLREMCDRRWVGRWFQFPDGSRRWKIRIRAKDVPFRELTG